MHISQITYGKILEIGTGYGVSSAWILSNIAPNVKFVSVDHAKEKIDATAQTIRHQQAEFLVGAGKKR